MSKIIMKLMTLQIPSNLRDAIDCIGANSPLYPSRAEFIRRAVADFLEYHLFVINDTTEDDLKPVEEPWEGGV